MIFPDQALISICSNIIFDVILIIKPVYTIFNKKLFLCSPFSIQVECHINNSQLTSNAASQKHIVGHIPNYYLEINRETNKIREITRQQHEQKSIHIPKSHTINFYLLLGTIIIRNQPYLLIVSEVNQVAKYIQYPIYAVTDVQFFPYRTKIQQNNEEGEEESKVIAQLKANYLNKYFYFSYHENITNSLYLQENSSKSQKFNDFAWNKAILNDFRRSKINNFWKIPIIQGFVAEISQKNIKCPYRYLSISRRSIHMSGTRFNSRGLDEEGNTSNFVQTEQIFICNKKLYDHTSIRGSVPLFWKQGKGRSSIQFTKDKKINEQQVMKRHYYQLQSKYKADILTINLLSKQNQPQKTLRHVKLQLQQRFEASLKRNIKFKYLYFDLNEQLKDQEGQKHVSNFIESNIDTIFGESAYLLIDLENNKVLQTQSIIPRTNCLDCLDRTNVIMARISQLFIRFVHKDAALEIDESFIKMLIKIWTKIGNRISEIYCGTGSIASHLTKKKNNSFKTFLGGALISINRYINANTTDVFKQQCIEYLLGQREDSKTEYFNSSICLSKIKQSNFSIWNKITISIITFCTSKININHSQSMEPFLTALSCQSSIVVFHLQQVSEQQRWIQLFQRQLSTMNYSLFLHFNFKGFELLTIIFTKTKNENKQFSYKFHKIVQIPLRSYGALAIFIEVESSIVCFINCKLESGFHNKSRRLENLNSIHKILMAQTSKSNLLRNCDAIFLAGNLNLRLSNNIDKEFKYKNMIEQLHNCSFLKAFPQPLIAQALKYDELSLLAQSQFVEYSEGDIDFLPTYKWQKKSTFDKAKHPAWCDRILFSNGLKSNTRIQENKKEIKCQYYKIIDENFGSNHKAVISKFNFDVKLQIQSIKRQLILKYLWG